MNPQPTPTLARTLETSRIYVLDSVQGLNEDEARKRPAQDRWSVLECLEHLVIVEGRFVGWIENGRPREPERSWEREARLFGMIRDRSTKVQAPEAVIPSGLFATLAEAIAAFNEARDRTARMVAARGMDLYGIGVKHPRFGDMNAAELMNLLAGHAQRHADQIREMRGMEVG